MGYSGIERRDVIWLLRQKDRYWKGQLTKREIALLETLPNWNWSVRVKRSVNDWVLVAEELARKNGGQLPSVDRMKKLGLTGLISKLYSHQSKFSHIPRAKPIVVRRNDHEWVDKARELAENNGGKLPGFATLVSMGYEALTQRLYDKPELFSGIAREKSFISLEEHVKIAEDLTKEHGGYIPAAKWLKSNGYSRLYDRIASCPEAFSHLPRKTLPKMGRARGSKNK